MKKINIEKAVNKILKDDRYPYIVRFHGAIKFLHLVSEYAINMPFLAMYDVNDIDDGLKQMDAFIDIYDSTKYFLKYGDSPNSNYLKYMKEEGRIIDGVYYTLLDYWMFTGRPNKDKKTCEEIGVKAFKELIGGLI